MSENTPSSESRGNWGALFQSSRDAIFLLNSRRRLRYVNPAWEAMTRLSSSAVVHEYCWPRKWKQDLPANVRQTLQAMAPPPEALQGQITTCRRAAPPGKLGPPWWDLTFLPLRTADRLTGIIGLIRLIPGVKSPVAGLPAIKGMSPGLGELRESAYRKLSWDYLEHASPVSQKLLAQARLATSHSAPITLIGEPGTGKETLARRIHAHSRQREKCFLALDGAGLQPYLIRSLLFGHNGLGETGRIGTLYIRSPEALPADLRSEIADWVTLADQAPRVIVGYHPQLDRNDDFAQNFAVVELRLPALRELASDFPAMLSRSVGRSYTPGFLQTLQSWKWPRNYREWNTTLRDALLQAGDQPLDVDHLPRELRVERMSQELPPPRTQSPGLDQVLEQVERRMIILALKQCGGDQTAAAERLGIHRSRLVRRLQALGIT